ncbi:hypothetical protein CASFOL_014568 [Castilleja foliolosa]|uniref:Ethylene-responsive nuclear protein n=1 Tax=Castilleja foliolosa TaxID=1961234 RepID=A0ABD3DN82_9LAMI
MPLQWKKAMRTGVSQLVNDHLHRSQKRRNGSSLFVETGFPTSLVDLFIKNRDKLKKPSKKNCRNPPIPVTPLSETDDLVITGSTSICPSQSPLISPAILPPRMPCEGVNENRVLELGVGLDERQCVSDTGVDANMVLLVVLKMFLVVILALGTKRLTIGITISAFLLFFLEYVGKHGRAVLKSTVESVLRLLRFKNVVKLDEKVLNGPGYVNHEIHVVESNQHPEIEIQPENEIIEAPSNQRRLGYQEIEPEKLIGSSTCEVVELKTKSRKSKIKSKMKKLVPKKLRCSRKGPGTESVKIVDEEDSSVWLCDDEVERESDNFTSELSSISSRKFKEDDDEMSPVRSFGELLEIDEKRDETRNGLNWRYLVLCVIVLTGLVGGRSFAVLLTLSWFLILKFGENLPSYMKVPMIKPF